MLRSSRHYLYVKDDIDTLWPTSVSAKSFAVRRDEKSANKVIHQKQTFLFYFKETQFAPCHGNSLNYLRLRIIPTYYSFCLLQQTEKDLLLHPELEEVTASHPTCFKLWDIIDRDPDGKDVVLFYRCSLTKSITSV